MGKNKLKKFNDMENFPFVFQYPWGKLQQEPFPHKGKWNVEVFKNSNPIVLELGCGKGEYTTGLAAISPDRNYIGIDVKGARMWTGAKLAHESGMANVAFLRTDIELLPQFFAPGEVAEIWITFPDPQMQKPRRRLTGTRMLDVYKKVLANNGSVNLKTDSPFLYEYTGMLIGDNNLKLNHNSADVYAGAPVALPQGVREIQTYYEQQWISRGLSIKFLGFTLNNGVALKEPADADNIEKDTYRSFSRGELQMPKLLNNDE